MCDASVVRSMQFVALLLLLELLSFHKILSIQVWEGYSEEGMEEWYRGELDGNAGWFPKAYAECVTGDDTTADLSQDTRDSSLMDAFR